MTNIAAGCLTVFFLVLCGLAWRVRTNAAGIASEPSLELIGSEKSYVMSRPYRLSVRVDRIYQYGLRLRLLELKTRRHQRVYRSDIIELSAQRLAVEHQTGQTVDDTAYVLTKTPAGSKVYHIQLLPRTEVNALIARRRAILGGEFAPHYAADCAVCGQCQYRLPCANERAVVAAAQKR